MTREVEIIERLARIESKLDSQDEDIRELKVQVRTINEALHERTELNGSQNVSIAVIDKRLSYLEKQQSKREWRVWTAFIAAVGAFLQGFFEWFFRR